MTKNLGSEQVVGTSREERFRAEFPIDRDRMREDCLARVRAELERAGLAAALVFDPLNLRYTTSSGIATVLNLHTAMRWALVPVDSEPIVWELADAMGVLRKHWPDGDFRPAQDWHFFTSGHRDRDDARRFAEEIADVLRERGILGEKIGVDRLDIIALMALHDAGLRIDDAQRPIETARAVKTEQERQALRLSARVCDAAVAELREAIEPGRTENELWGTLQGASLKLGGEYPETRLLCSGPRTNPWMQEASSRQVRDGELVVFDTDLVGPNGYYIDISRAYLAGDGPATAEQRRLHAIAHDYVYSALDEFRPGISFAELGEKLSARLDPIYHPQRYSYVAHGAGLGPEYPGILFEDNYDGVIEEHMSLSMEAYIGEVGGAEGVKLEEQFLVTATGFELLSSAPFDERLL